MDPEERDPRTFTGGLIRIRSGSVVCMSISDQDIQERSVCYRLKKQRAALTMKKNVSGSKDES